MQPLFIIQEEAVKLHALGLDYLGEIQRKQGLRLQLKFHPLLSDRDPSPVCSV